MRASGTGLKKSNTLYRRYRGLNGETNGKANSMEIRIWSIKASLEFACLRAKLSSVTVPGTE